MALPYETLRSLSFGRTTHSRTPLDECSALRRNRTCQHTMLLRDRHPRSQPNSNPQSQPASDRRPRLGQRPLRPAVYCVLLKQILFYALHDSVHLYLVLLCLSKCLACLQSSLFSSLSSGILYLYFSIGWEPSLAIGWHCRIFIR